MTPADPMTPAELAEIAARRAEYLKANSLAALNLAGFAIEKDIPRLLAEVERLAAENARLSELDSVRPALMLEASGNIRSLTVDEKDKIIAEAMQGLKDHADADADVLRLTREIDVILHGKEDAAEQSLLCDVIEPIRKLKAENARLRDAERIAVTLVGAWDRDWSEMGEVDIHAAMVRAGVIEKEPNEEFAYRYTAIGESLKRAAIDAAKETP